MTVKFKTYLLSFLLLFGQFTWVINPAYASGNDMEKASQYADTAHNAYQSKDFLKAGQFYERAYSSYKKQVFLDNAVTSYLSYAFDMSNERNYDKAILYCQKALGLKSNDKNAKELLADIYYSRGSNMFYKGLKNNAKADFEKSLQYSVLPEQSQRARQALSDIKTGGLAGTADEDSDSYSISGSQSVPELIELMELKVYGSCFENLPVIERVKKIEKDILAKTYENDSLAVRINRLKDLLLPELKNAPLSAAADKNDYVNDVISQSRGPVRLFSQKPIKVFFNEPDAKIYKKEFQAGVMDAFKEWQAASGDVLQFEKTNDPRLAHIMVSWTDYYNDFDWTPKLHKKDLALEKQKMKYKKASMLVRVGSMATMVAGALIGVPVLGTIGSLGGGVATPLLAYKGMDLDDNTPEIKINTAITEELDEENKKNKIKQIALHQIGHVIGIYAHSSNPEDIMYENFTTGTLSERDKNTIKQIYNNLSNN